MLESQKKPYLKVAGLRWKKQVESVLAGIAIIYFNGIPKNKKDRHSSQSPVDCQRLWAGRWESRNLRGRRMGTWNNALRSTTKQIPVLAQPLTHGRQEWRLRGMVHAEFPNALFNVNGRK